MCLIILWQNTVETPIKLSLRKCEVTVGDQELPAIRIRRSSGSRTPKALAGKVLAELGIPTGAVMSFVAGTIPADLTARTHPARDTWGITIWDLEPGERLLAIGGS